MKTICLCLLVTAFTAYSSEFKYINGGSLCTKTELDLYNLIKMTEKKDHKGISGLIKNKQVFQLKKDTKVELLEKDYKGLKAKVKVVKNKDIYWVLTKNLKDQSEELKKKYYVNLNEIMVSGTVFERKKLTEIIDYLEKETKNKKLRFKKAFEPEKGEDEPDVSIVFTDMPLKMILNQLCKDLKLKYTLKKRTITFYKKHQNI